MTVLVMIACNNPDNGMFEGRFDALHIETESHDELSFMAFNPIAVEVDHKKKILMIEGMQMNFTKSQEWHGNWCWNAYRVSPEKAARLLNFVIRKGWKPDMGTNHLFEKAERKSTFEAEDLIEV